MKPTPEQIKQLKELFDKHAVDIISGPSIPKVIGIEALLRLAPEVTRIMNSKSLTLLRDLADLQNGPPLETVRKEWEETMKDVYEFLNENEKVEPQTHLTTGTGEPGTTYLERGWTFDEKIDMKWSEPKELIVSVEKIEKSEFAQQPKEVRSAEKVLADLVGRGDWGYFEVIKAMKEYANQFKQPVTDHIGEVNKMIPDEVLRIELEKYDTWCGKNPNYITGSDIEIRERYINERKERP